MGRTNYAPAPGTMGVDINRDGITDFNMAPGQSAGVDVNRDGITDYMVSNNMRSIPGPMIGSRPMIGSIPGPMIGSSVQPSFNPVYAPIATSSYAPVSMPPVSIAPIATSSYAPVAVNNTTIPNTSNQAGRAGMQFQAGSRKEPEDYRYLGLGPLAQMGGKPLDQEMQTDWNGRQVGLHNISWEEYLDKHEVGVYSRHYRACDNYQNHYHDTHAGDMSNGARHHMHHIHKPREFHPVYQKVAGFCQVMFPA